MTNLEDSEEPVEGFALLCTMQNRCGGRVTITGTRLEPRYIVFYVNNYGADYVLDVWKYLSQEAIDECFRYMALHPKESLELKDRAEK